MPSSQTPLPEGTDSIISSTGVDDVVGGGAAFTGDTYAGSAGGAGASGGGFGAGGQSGTGGSSSPAAGSAASKVGDAAAQLGDAASAKVGEATAGLRAQATDKAYGLVAQGKDRTVGLLDNVTQLVEDAAGQIDEKAGEQYGAYARQASQAVAGLADTLRDKDVEELVDDARQLVRRSPAIAIGAAAAVGFLLARVLKVGLAEGAAAASDQPLDSPYVAPTARTQTSTPSTATTAPAGTVL